MQNRHHTEQCLFNVAAQYTVVKRFLAVVAVRTPLVLKTRPWTHQTSFEWASTLNISYSITIKLNITKYKFSFHIKIKIILAFRASTNTVTRMPG